MKSKKIFAYMLILTMVLTLSGLTVFAETSNSIDTHVICNKENHVHNEDSAIVILSGGEVLFKLKFDSKEFNEDVISKVAGDMFVESYVQNGKDEVVHPQEVTCCSNPLWRVYVQENHVKRGSTCYVDVYDRYICRNCGTSYKEFSHSYSHSAASCPYL